MTRRGRRQASHPAGPGLTLVEILITLVLVAAMFTPIFRLVQQSTLRTYRAGDETFAAIYATDVMELIRGGPYEAFFPGGKNPEKDLTLDQVFGRSVFFKNYDRAKYRTDRFTITADVGPVEDVIPAKLKQVIVHVRWTDRLGHPKALKLATFYSPSTL